MSPAQAASFVDKGHAVFYPKRLGERLEFYKDFPATWWNILVFDMKGREKGWEKAQRLCDLLKNFDEKLISRVECRQDLKQYLSLLQDWARDLPLRQDRPPDQYFLSAMNQAFSKASLPMDRTGLSHLRNDPLASDKELRTLVTRHLLFNVEQKNGFLFHPSSERILIPIQFRFSPDQDELTSQFYEKLNEHCLKEKDCGQWVDPLQGVLVGSHASTWENKRQIMKDVALVSQTGTALLILFCLCLVVMRRSKLLFIIPPILFSIALAVIVTVRVYGSIHGLVLSFGTGLVGISYDYGSHSALNPGIKSIWKANWFGYLTTVAVLGVLMFSQIPLLQQLMFFSIVGLTFAFFILLLLHRFFPEYSRARPLPLVPQVRKWKMALVLLVWLGLFFSWGINLRLGMSGFDFQSVPQQVVSSWLFKNVKTGIPLFEIHSMDKNHSPLEDMHRRLRFGKARKIEIQNAAEYLPPVGDQSLHLSTWKNSCNDPGFLKNLDESQKIFFEPYLKTIACEALTTNGLSLFPFPSYVADFNSGFKWITLWLPKNGEEAEQILSEFPETTSLKSLANIFPSVLIKEITWMGPLSFGLVTLLLFFYFKNLKMTLIALIPFVTGLGLISWFHFISGLSFSFIGLIALVMIYGMSVDFGIFAADTYRHSHGNEAYGVWTALLMAALTTVAGFIPLDFCRHPVLIDLGRTLTLGMIGTVLGTFWGVPFALQRLKKKMP